MVFQSLEIKRFRGIEYLKVDDLRHINLVIGKNNSGKTSILEALFLVTGISNPNLSANINFFRGLTLTDDRDFSFNFFKLDFNNTIELKAIQANQRERLLTITPIFQAALSNVNDSFKDEQSKFESSVSSTDQNEIDGIKLDFLVEGQNKENNHSYSSEYSINRKKRTIPREYFEEIKANFYSVDTSTNGLLEKLERLFVDKKLDELIPVLKKIDSSISDIRIGANGMVYVDNGYDKLSPLNIMGDGIRRLVSLIASIYSVKNGILLIDEIENGFHYSIHKILWRAVFDAAKKYNVQIFATTHSYECIKAFSDINNEFLNLDELRLFRVEKKENNHKIIKYTSELLESALESKWEVR